MSVNGIINSTSAYEAKNTGRTKTNQSTDSRKTKETVDSAAVYEKSKEPSTKNKTYKRDDLTVDRMIAEAEKRTKQLRDLVQKLLKKQGQTMDEATDIYSLLREGKLEVDPETRAQAQKDIAEDGYWGVEQTSERMFSFAKALTGGDPAKADEMIEAVKKGFEEATKAWGGELPGICKQTMETAIKKLESWRAQSNGSDKMSSETSKAYQSQASASRIAK